MTVSNIKIMSKHDTDFASFSNISYSSLVHCFSKYFVYFSFEHFVKTSKRRGAMFVNIRAVLLMYCCLFVGKEVPLG